MEGSKYLILTDATSIKYFGRTWLSLSMLGSESLVGVVSIAVSILRRAFMLSTGGLRNWNKSQDVMSSKMWEKILWSKAILTHLQDFYSNEMTRKSSWKCTKKVSWGIINVSIEFKRMVNQLTIWSIITLSTIWKIRQLSPICDKQEQTALVSDRKDARIDFPSCFSAKDPIDRFNHYPNHWFDDWYKFNIQTWITKFRN